jgi:hypothetical protein
MLYMPSSSVERYFKAEDFRVDLVDSGWVDRPSSLVGLCVWLGKKIHSRSWKHLLSIWVEYRRTI